MNGTARRFVTDTALYGASRAFLALRNVVYIAVFFQILDAREARVEYGLYTQVQLLAWLVAPIVSLRLGPAAVRFLCAEEDPVTFRRHFYSAFACVLVGSAGVLALVWTCGTWVERAILGTSKGELSAGMACMIASTAIMAFLQNYYRIVDRIQRLACLDLTQAMFEVAVVYAVMHAGTGAAGALIGSAAARGAWSLFLFADIVRRQGIVARFFDWKALRGLLAFSLPLIPNEIARWFFGYADRVVLVHALGPDVAPVLLGIYNATFQFGGVIERLLSPINFVFYPLISRLWDQGRTGEARSYFSQVLRYYLLVTIPAAIGCVLIAPEVLALLSDGGLHTTHALVFASAGSAVAFGFFQICSFTFHLSKETRFVSAILLPCGALAVILNIALVSLVTSLPAAETHPELALLGAGAAELTVFLLMAVIAYRAGRTRVGYTIPWHHTAKALIAAIAIHVALGWVISPSWGSVAITVATSIVVYFSVLIAMGVLSRRELRGFASIFGS